MTWLTTQLVQQIYVAPRAHVQVSYRNYERVHANDQMKCLVHIAYSLRNRLPIMYPLWICTDDGWWWCCSQEERVRQVLQGLPRDSLATLRLVTELLSKVPYSQNSVVDEWSEQFNFSHVFRGYLESSIALPCAVPVGVVHTLHMEISGLKTRQAPFRSWWQTKPLGQCSQIFWERRTLAIWGLWSVHLTFWHGKLNCGTTSYESEILVWT